MPDKTDIEKILKVVSDRYKLCVVASKRARALNLGEKPLAESKYKNNALIALEEIAAGKIRLAHKPSSRAEEKGSKE